FVAIGAPSSGSQPVGELASFVTTSAPSSGPLLGGCGAAAPSGAATVGLSIGPGAGPAASRPSDADPPDTAGPVASFVAMGAGRLASFVTVVASRSATGPTATGSESVGGRSSGATTAQRWGAHESELAPEVGGRGSVRATGALRRWIAHGIEGSA